MDKLTLKDLTIYKSDCLAFLKTVEDNSVDLIATDPPYYKVKNDGWDNQWESKGEYFIWLNQVLCELSRVLKPTGSLYLFAGPHTATEVEQAVSNHFDILNHIIWRKPTGRHLGCCKESLRRYFPQTEHIIFAGSLKRLPFAFESIRQYLDNAIEIAGVTRREVDDACGCQMSAHWFGKSQWSLPSEQHYQTINKLVGGQLKPYKNSKLSMMSYETALTELGERSTSPRKSLLRMYGILKLFNPIRASIPVKSR